jgi:hypothetical protein
MQNISWFSPALGALAAALAALATYHYAAVRPRLRQLQRLAADHDALIAGGSGSAADRLGALEIRQTAAAGLVEELARRVAELESRSKQDLSRVGFVRYDAFEDTGSNLSYALALLNREGDGVVLTSLYSRTDTRTYAKAVERFKPAANASEEELAAIERARSA